MLQWPYFCMIYILQNYICTCFVDWELNFFEKLVVTEQNWKRIFNLHHGTAGSNYLWNRKSIQIVLFHPRVFLRGRLFSPSWKQKKLSHPVRWWFGLGMRVCWREEKVEEPQTSSLWYILLMLCNSIGWENFFNVFIGIRIVWFFLNSKKFHKWARKT